MSSEQKKYRKRAPGRPKRSEQEGKMDTEQQIIHHAALLFMKSGYAAVSISSITKAAGITKPTLYHYFPDKEHLYAAVICNCLKRTSKEIIEEIRGEASVRQKLFGLAYGFFRFASMSVSTLMRDVDEQLQPHLIKQVHDTYDQFIVEPHCELIREGMATGELLNQPERVRILADIWIGMLDALSTQAFYIRQDHEKLLQITQVVVSVFMDGIVDREKTC